MDVDVSIHIAEPANRSPNGRSGNPNKRSVPDNKQSSKARKRQRSKNPIRVKEVAAKSAAGLTEEPSDRTASFRHLFSFSEQGGTTSAGESTVENKSRKSKPFSLLGGGQEKGGTGQFGLFNEQGAPERLGDAHRQTKPWDTKLQVVRDADARQAQGNGLAFAIAERNAKDHGTSQRNSVLGDDNHFDRTRRKNVTPPFRGRHNMETQVPDAPAIPDEIDTSPEAILALANKFCRTKSIEQLEKEWCEVNGIQDEMKRDFKLKRTRSLRDRNLGRGAHRA